MLRARRRCRRPTELGEIVETRPDAGVVADGAAPSGRVQPGHVPAFLAGEPAGRWLCVYPFVRSYEWYLLPESERRELLAEHGQRGREYADVRANTVASFALGDYEWLLAFEAEELHRIVDLMRHLRGSGARRHVREEIPFYTGQRISPARWTRCSPSDRSERRSARVGLQLRLIELMQ